MSDRNSPWSNRSFRVLVTDLDHTLFPPGSERLPENFPGLVRLWRRQGHYWIVATGRSVGDLQKFYNQWPVIPDYTVARERFIIQHVSRGWFPFSEWNQTMMQKTIRVNQQSYRWIQKLQDRITGKDLLEQVESRYVVFRSVQEARNWETWLNQQLPEGLRTLRNREYLGLRSNAFGKGTCLRKISGIRQWNPKTILTIGDSSNDDDMLDGRFGFYPVAVDNAEPMAKDWVREGGGTVLEQPGGEAVVTVLKWLLRPFLSSS